MHHKELPKSSPLTDRPFPLMADDAGPNSFSPNSSADNSLLPPRKENLYVFFPCFSLLRGGSLQCSSGTDVVGTKSSPQVVGAHQLTPLEVSILHCLHCFNPQSRHWDKYDGDSSLQVRKPNHCVTCVRFCSGEMVEP